VVVRFSSLHILIPPVLLTAYCIFLTNVLFGLLVKIGVIDNRRLRVVHHLLYFLVVVSLLVATLLAFLHRERSGYAMAGMTALLLCMPLFRGRSRGRWIFATCCAGLYTALVAWR
jgi:hypothetical protein